MKNEVIYSARAIRIACKIGNEKALEIAKQMINDERVASILKNGKISFDEFVEQKQKPVIQKRGRRLSGLTVMKNANTVNFDNAIKEEQMRKNNNQKASENNSTNSSSNTSSKQQGNSAALFGKFLQFSAGLSTLEKK